MVTLLSRTEVTSSSTNEAGGLKHAAAGKVWAQTCSVMIRVYVALLTHDAPTPLFTGRVRSASVAIWLRSVRVQLGHVCQGPQRPTDMTGVPHRKPPRNINERGRRSSDLAAVSCPSLLACVRAHPDVRIQMHCSGAEVTPTKHLLFCYAFERHWRE